MAVWVGFAFGVIDGKAVLVGLTVHVGVGEGGRGGSVGGCIRVADGMASGVGDGMASGVGD
ncbi:MAG: hypothetical protein WCD51_14120 [Anaerolineae bacterium]